MLDLQLVQPETMLLQKEMSLKPKYQVFLDTSLKQIFYELNHAELGSTYWDNFWHAERRPDWKSIFYSTFVSHTTLKYLNRGSKILDAGCGDGRHVYSLQNSGFCAYGIDYATESISFIHSHTPDLQVALGDVTSMPYADNFFDGIWSIGVIEHFINGYDDVFKEARRCLRSDGYLFLTFPAMNPYRYLQIRFRHVFRLKAKAPDPDYFYQYLLPPQNTINKARHYNFEKVHAAYRSGLKGLKDSLQSTLIGRILSRAIRGADSGNIYLKSLLKLVDIASSPIFGHSYLIVFKKR
jgi:SAM-dependent methyltransferase